MVVSCFSCLTVTSFAADTPVDSGKVEDEEGNETTTWEFFDDGKLYIYQDVEGPEWISHTNEIKEVYVQGNGTEPCAVTTIPNGAFKGYPNLELVSLEKAAGTLETIGAYAFSNCDKLTSIMIPGAATLGDSAFYDCDALTTVFVGGGLSTVGENVFKSCDNLETVNFAAGIYEIGYGMFEDCVKLSNFTFPDSLTTIGELAFDNCQSLTEIVLPDGLTEVGRYAFHDCINVTSAYIGHKTKTIGEYALYGCTSLKDVEIACATEVLSEGLFMDCVSLENIKIEESIEIIEKNVFKNCEKLVDFQLPITVVEIGDTAFANTGLTSVKIPAEVTKIEKGAFTSCDALSAIDVDVYNDNYYSFDGVLYDMALSTVVVCPAGKSGDYKVKDGTTTIAEDAFIGCTNLTSVEIPASVTEIANSAFNGCAGTVVIKANCDSYANEYAISRGIKTDLTHTTSSWKETLAPTCLDKGTKQLVCDGCGLVYETSDIDALGHTYDDGVITTKATCTTDGVVKFTCTRANCGDSYTQVIPATNHKYNDGEMVVPVTCTTDGTKRYTCQNDGCYDIYDEIVPALGHKYNGVVTTAPTCTDKGVKTFTCANCGDTYTEDLDAIGHNYDAGVVTTAPTCTDKGVKTFTCANCGDTYTEDLDAIGHDYVTVVVKESTCITQGTQVTTCQNCGEATTTKLPFGAHQWHSTEVTLAPTCTKDGMKGNKCALCGIFADDAVVLPATGHKYNETTGMCQCGASNGQQKPVTGGSTVITPINPGSSSSKPQTNPETKPATKLATPKMVSVKNSGSGKNSGIKVVWNKVDGAVKYRLYRRTTGEGWKLYDVVTSTSYLDKNAAVGKSWRYTVRAVAADGTLSGYESGLYVRRVLTPHLTGIKNTAAGVEIKWSKVSTANSYRVYRAEGKGDWEYIGTTSSTKFVDKKAVSGKTYKYTVRAISYSPSAYESGLTIKFIATPDVKAATNTSKGVKVTWSKVAGASSYRVYRKTAGGSWVRIATVKNTSYIDSAVKSKYGKKYTYTVKAVSGKTTSAYEKGITVKRAK